MKLIESQRYDPFDQYVKDYKGYNGNQLIKKAGVQVEWTPEMVQEFFKCKQDPVYFAEKYMKILVKGKGLVKIHLFPYQVDMIRAMQNNRFNVFATARQAGKSTVVCAFVLWYLIFSDFKPLVGFLANKGPTAREILGKVKLAYENLPRWLQHGVVTWNKGSIEFENGSRAIAESTSSDSIRGYSIDLLFVDEAAFVEKWDEFWPSTFNTITSSETTKVVLVSTPNGLNHFHAIWELANRKGQEDWNEFTPIKVTWDQVPGRDEKWRQTALKGVNFDQDKFNQEHCVEFLGSSGTLIAGWKLKQLSAGWKPPKLSKDSVEVFTEPVPGRKYILTADVSEGKGLDFSAFHVIDVTTNHFDQVCVYRNNLITPIEYASIILRIAKYYNNASVLVELNSIGSQVCSILWDDYEYENMIHTQSAGPKGKEVSGGFSPKQTEIGIRTTKTVKGTGCSLVKMLIEQGKLDIHHHDTVYELSRFSRKGKSWEAEEGATDDLVMPLVLFGWLTDQQYFKDLTDIDILNQLRDRSDKEIMEELAPFVMQNNSEADKSKELLGENKEGWALDNTDPRVRLYF